MVELFDETRPASGRPRGRPQGSAYERVEGRLTRAQIVALEAVAGHQGITRAEALRRAVDAYVGLVPVRGIVPRRAGQEGST